MTTPNPIKLSDQIPWCIDWKGHYYTYDEFVNQVQLFHGHLAPGLLIGGKMVYSALKQSPKDRLLDALCESSKCLPDAIQILTPCTIGNGWLKILPLYRFALTLYDKYSGDGCRVFLDARKVEQWPEIKTWFFKLKPKQEQNTARLFSEIKQAGDHILSHQPVRVAKQFLQKDHVGMRTLCPRCHELFPVKQGKICSACQGNSPYVSPKETSNCR